MPHPPRLIPPRVLESYSLEPLPGATPEPVAGGFSGAGVWRVAAARGTFAVRCWTPGIPEARLRGLHRLLRHLFEAGSVRIVPVPLQMPSGETFVMEGGRTWHVEPWMPGRADFHRDPRPERLAAAMEALARWHFAAATFSPRDSEREWFRQAVAEPSPAVAQRSALLNDWTSGKLRRVKEKLALAPASKFRELSERVLLAAPALAPPIARRLESVRTTPFRLQPCLRDIWHDHVLFEGDIVRGLIDPAACRTENVATDLARLLGSLIADDRSMWGDAVEAYRRVAHLSGAEFDLCRTLDQSGVLLSALSWLERACLQNDPAAAHPAVLDRLSRFADRLEHLASDFW